ncbi:uncharacterized protein LOC124418865 isoform X1 [Lucilia cuprina]|uniref:uncharacterized protein LOC124418865 isoform X1 n=1 Tax=Lucilia cuprina TaxID=7375 RepID=UPI001F0554A8|nr:uncharacterized protein LOC124418865 isoform X1 [Lucilia cuprina]
MCEEIIEEIFDLTELAIENLDLDDYEDIEIILELLQCCESVGNIRNKRQKREWVKKWRLDRVERGTFSFLMNDLFNDSSSFLNYIRMKPETFNYILSKIENDLKRQDTLMRKSITPAEKLAATLRYLATGESYKSTNYQTRLSESLLCGAIPEVCNAIWKHFKDEFLKFPATKSDWQNIADNFAIKWQFPNCLGALDGKHITFQALRKDGSFFYNYKGTNSIVLLALVDADCRFIYIDVGCNGRTHDAGVLLQSDLKNIIDNAETYFPEDKVIGNGRRLPFVIIGDDAFPLQRHIMKPYSSNTTIKKDKFSIFVFHVLGKL